MKKILFILLLAVVQLAQAVPITVKADSATGALIEPMNFSPGASGTASGDLGGTYPSPYLNSAIGVGTANNGAGDHLLVDIYGFPSYDWENRVLFDYYATESIALTDRELYTGHGFLINGMVKIDTTYEGWDVAADGFDYVSPDLANAIYMPLTASTGYKNVLIGGDFSTNPWQRGTNFPALSSAQYGPDRWYIRPSASGQFSVSKQATSGLSGFMSAMRMGRISGSTTAGFIQATQVISTANTVSGVQGRVVTVSFWAQTGADYSGANTFTIRMTYGSGIDEGVAAVLAGTWTGGANVGDVLITPTATWTKYTATGTIPATATELAVSVFYFTTGTAGAADYVDVAGMQLEANYYATAFEGRPAELELELCQSYYETGGGELISAAVAVGQCTSTTTASAYIPFKTSKRVFPTITLQGAASDWGLVGALGTTINVSAITAASPTAKGFIIEPTVASGLVAGNATTIFCRFTTAKWVADAEL